MLLTLSLPTFLCVENRDKGVSMIVSLGNCTSGYPTLEGSKHNGSPMEAWTPQTGHKKPGVDPDICGLMG